MERDRILKLRKDIKWELENYKGQNRLYYSKHVLENILFETFQVVFYGHVLNVKVPVWNGEFLSKLDLSQVDFSDCLWATSFCYDHNANGSFFGELLENIRKIRQTFSFPNGSDYDFCFKDTNANIDLTTSFCYNLEKNRHQGLVFVHSCDFSGSRVRIKESSEVHAVNIMSSSLSNTGLNIPGGVNLCFRESDMTNLDLSHLTINGLDSEFKGTTFKNTGVNVNLDIRKMREYLDIDYNFFLQEFKKMLNEYFIGCYVNGILLESKEDAEANLRLVLK